MLREGKYPGEKALFSEVFSLDEEFIMNPGLLVASEKIEFRVNSKIHNIAVRLEEVRESSLEGINFNVIPDLFILHQRLFQECSHPLSRISVPSYHHFDKAYWNILSSADENAYIERGIGLNVKIWCGPASILNIGVLALIVNMSTNIYSSELLQTSEVAEKIALGTLSASGKKVTGKNYERLQLRYRQQLEAELLLAMMHSFRDDYLVALVIASHQGKKYIVGSMGAMRGSGEKSLRETKIEAGAPQIHPSLLSSLPTQAALSFAYNQDGEELADLPESSLAEITRLNVVSADLLKQVASEADRATVSASLMMIIHEGIARNWPDVSHEIFNTQPALHRVLRKHGLPVKIISEPNSIQPTTVVGETIHGVYFKKKPPIPQSLSVAAACVVAEQFFQQLSNNQ